MNIKLTNYKHENGEMLLYIEQNNITKEYTLFEADELFGEQTITELYNEYINN